MTGPSRRHIQGSKIAKGLPSVNLQYSKIGNPKNGPSGARNPGALKGGHFRNGQHFCRNWRGRKNKFSRKSHNAEKLKGGGLWGFSTSILSQNIKKLKGGKFLFSEKISKCRKKIERGDPLVSPGMICYAEKQEKPFWFSSLGQMVQFGAIIFCRTFKNYFDQFVWIEKKSHYNSSVSLHEAPTKNLHII